MIRLGMRYYYEVNLYIGASKTVDVRKVKSMSATEIIKLLLINCLVIIIFGVISANIYYAILYSRTDSSKRDYSWLGIYNNDDSLCVTTTLWDVPPHFIVPAFKVKFVLDGETVPIWDMYVSLDHNPYSFDILEYRGDNICTQHNFDKGSYQLEVIEVNCPENMSRVMWFEVLDDGKIRVG